MTPVETTSPRPSRSGQNTDAAVQRIQEELERTRVESEGMGNELLRAYEQLGIVFQLTRQLGTHHDEEQVLDLFLSNLQAVYGPDQVFLAWINRHGHLRTRPRMPSVPELALEVAIRCRDEKRVVVQTDGGSDFAKGWSSMQIMSAPVFCGSTFVAAVQVERTVKSGDNQANASRELDSGDMLLLDSLSSFCGDLIGNLRLTEEIRQASVDTVRALVSAVDQKDAYTSGHSNRVGYYAGLLGRELGLDEEALQNLNWSALLHDVGKIGIRDDVLKKAGPLTDDEFKHIQEHPRRGYEVVRQIPHFSIALDGVLHHHEHFDGQGYPDGLAGTDIPLQARIIQIADVFDALTTSRAYRGAFSWTQALAILKDEAGTTVDPDLGASFEKLMRRLFASNPNAFDQIGRDASVPRLEGDTAR
ncbi:MAG: HD-GYP domain-containing protein [Planctomycetes bacterium]|nr:HD-GYP domain-containing protein [Planctomycetota bacterium]